MPITTPSLGDVNTSRPVKHNIARPLFIVSEIKRDWNWREISVYPRISTKSFCGQLFLEKKRWTASFLWVTQEIQRCCKTVAKGSRHLQTPILWAIAGISFEAFTLGEGGDSKEMAEFVGWLEFSTSLFSLPQKRGHFCPCLSSYLTCFLLRAVSYFYDRSLPPCSPPTSPPLTSLCLTGNLTILW